MPREFLLVYENKRRDIPLGTNVKKLEDGGIFNFLIKTG